MDALAKRLGAGGFHRRQAVGQYRAEDIDHLPVAVRDEAQLPSHLLHGGRQRPILEWRPIP